MWQEFICACSDTFSSKKGLRLHVQSYQNEGGNLSAQHKPVPSDEQQSKIDESFGGSVSDWLRGIMPDQEEGDGPAITALEGGAGAAMAGDTAGA